MNDTVASQIEQQLQYCRLRILIVGAGIAGATLAALLQLPEGASPLALLCIGPVPEFYDAPMLQQQRWASRMPLADVVFDNTWGQSAPFLQGLCQPGQSPMADNAGCDSSD